MRPDLTVTLHLLPEAALAALLADDLDRASEVVGVDLPAFFLSESWLWEIRLDQVRRSPEAAPWLVRAALVEPHRAVVGHAGFHGPPDAAGVVEVGYTVVPEHRGNGYGHLLLSALLDTARAATGVTRVRATVGPENRASLAIVTAAGFRHVGEQWDDVDGLELVFERDVCLKP